MSTVCLGSCSQTLLKMWCTLMSFPFVFLTVTTIHALNFVRKEMQKPYLQVRTVNGVVQGIKYTSQNQKYYYAYFGIPYAEPPIGQLRFREPREAKNWEGVLDGSKQRSFCVELIVTSKKLLAVTGNENCLFLNIFTRNNPHRGKRKRPVMVFFHGGAFQEGNANFRIYGPDFLVEKDVLLVILNYRVGLFGFLSTEDMASPGNYGLKDQNLALRWIQRNIKNFGGDPDNVTIFGQSAGAVSVHFHMLSHKSKGLFHRAIMDGGSALCHWSNQRKPRNVAFLLGAANGITNPKDSFDLIRRLREVEMDVLKETQVLTYVISLLSATLMGFPFAPTLEPIHEEAFITSDSWYEMLKYGKFNRVPVVIGNAVNETLFFSRMITALFPIFLAFEVDPGLYAPAALSNPSPEKALEIGKLVRNFYFGENGGITISDLGKAFQFSKSDFFSRPIRKSVLFMSQYVPVYYYQFSYDGNLGHNGLASWALMEKRRGARHTEILYYIFNKQNNFSDDEDDKIVRKRLVQLWTNFAKYSNPTPSRDVLLDSILWPAVSTVDEHQMQILDINSTLTVRQYPNENSEIEFWNKLFMKYSKSLSRSY